MMRNRTYRKLLGVIQMEECNFDECENLTRHIFIKYTNAGMSSDRWVRRVFFKKGWKRKSD